MIRRHKSYLLFENCLSQHFHLGPLSLLASASPPISLLLDFAKSTYFNQFTAQIKNKIATLSECRKQSQAMGSIIESSKISI